MFLIISTKHCDYLCDLDSKLEISVPRMALISRASGTVCDSRVFLIELPNKLILHSTTICRLLFKLPRWRFGHHHIMVNMTMMVATKNKHALQYLQNLHLTMIDVCFLDWNLSLPPLHCLFSVWGKSLSLSVATKNIPNSLNLVLVLVFTAPPWHCPWHCPWT